MHAPSCSGGRKRTVPSAVPVFAEVERVLAAAGPLSTTLTGPTDAFPGTVSEFLRETCGTGSESRSAAPLGVPGRKKRVSLNCGENYDFYERTYKRTGSDA